MTNRDDRLTPLLRSRSNRTAPIGLTTFVGTWRSTTPGADARAYLRVHIQALGRLIEFLSRPIKTCPS